LEKEKPTISAYRQAEKLIIFVFVGNEEGKDMTTKTK